MKVHRIIQSILVFSVLVIIPVQLFSQEGNLARIADDTRFANAYYFVEMEMPEKAAVLLSEYVEVYQNGIHRKEALLALGDIYYDKFDYQKARDFYMMLFEEYSNTEEGVEAYYRAALCYVKMGMSKKADAIFADILSNFSGYAAAEKARLQRDIESILSEEITSTPEAAKQQEQPIP